MKARVHIIILAVAATAAIGTQAAGAHMLAGDGGTRSAKSASSKSALALMTEAGIRYHAAANFRNEKNLVGSAINAKSKAGSVRGASHHTGGASRLRRVVPRIIPVAPASGPVVTATDTDACIDSMSSCTDQQYCDIWGFDCEVVAAVPQTNAAARPNNGGVPDANASGASASALPANPTDACIDSMSSCTDQQYCDSWGLNCGHT